MFLNFAFERAPSRACRQMVGEAGWVGSHQALAALTVRACGAMSCSYFDRPDFPES
jgi:hypothetical protein